MSVLTFIGSGQMASALSFPTFENGHEVRLVGTPLDREVIDGLKKDNYHINLKRTLHDGSDVHSVPGRNYEQRRFPNIRHEVA